MKALTMLIFAVLLLSALAFAQVDPEDLEELPCVLCCGAAILPLIATAAVFGKEKE